MSDTSSSDTGSSKCLDGENQDANSCHEVLGTTHCFYSDKQKTFRLFCGDSVYIFCITPELLLQTLYFGKNFGFKTSTFDIRYLTLDPNRYSFLPFPRSHVDSNETSEGNTEFIEKFDRAVGIDIEKIKSLERNTALLSSPSLEAAEDAPGGGHEFQSQNDAKTKDGRDNEWLARTKVKLDRWRGAEELKSSPVCQLTNADEDDSDLERAGHAASFDSTQRLPRNIDRMSQSAKVRSDSTEKNARTLAKTDRPPENSAESGIQSLPRMTLSHTPHDKALSSGRPDYTNTYDSIGYDSDILPSSSIPPSAEQIEAYHRAKVSLQGQSESPEDQVKHEKVDKSEFWGDVGIGNIGDIYPIPFVDEKTLSKHTTDLQERPGDDDFRLAEVEVEDVPLADEQGEASTPIAGFENTSASMQSGSDSSSLLAIKFADALRDAEASGVPDIRKLIQSVEWDSLQPLSPKEALITQTIGVGPSEVRPRSKWEARRVYDREDGRVGKGSLRLEYSDYGTGDFRAPSFSIADCYDGGNLSPLRYKSHQIYEGKLPMPDAMPAVQTSNPSEASTLVVNLQDAISGLEVQLVYVCMHNYSVITRRAVFKNASQRGNTPPATSPRADVNAATHGAVAAGAHSSQGGIDEAESRSEIIAGTTLYNRECNDKIIQKAYSMTLDFGPSIESRYLTELPGSWGRERQVKTSKLNAGITSFGSRSGASGHQHNPFAAFSVGPPLETTGEIIALSLVYSGNFILEAEADDFGRLRVNTGIHPNTMQWLLKQGKVFNTPEAILVRSSEGLGGMSRMLHRLFRDHLTPQSWAREHPPVLLNTWEACRFNVNHQDVVYLAKKAATLGIDLLVVDDGWFKGRSNDLSSLGDWIPSESKFPRGLKALADDVNALGLKLGLWLEPEMVSFDSDLNREHPHFWLRTPGRTNTDRNQMVLDLSNSAVVDYLFNAISKLLRSANIEYIKWDMSRALSDIYSLRAADLSTYHATSRGLPDEGVFQAETAHRYMLGLYSLHRLVSDAFPGVLIESGFCGGGRFDPGMLYFGPQIWASDNTDSLLRLKIQYGTSLAYPISSIGAHVSSVPNSVTGSFTRSRTRGFIAMCGTFGFELDLVNMTPSEEKNYREQVSIFHQYSHIILRGDLYRLWNPFQVCYCAFQFVDADQNNSIVFAFNAGFRWSDVPNILLLQGLLPNGEYEITEPLPAVVDKILCSGNGIEANVPEFQLGYSTVQLSGSILMRAGLPVRFHMSDDSVMFRLKRIKSLVSYK